MGIPFFKNTVFGDLVYTGLFFGGYELIQVLASKYSLKKAFVNKK
jgi:hypothetical protein